MRIRLPEGLARRVLLLIFALAVAASSTYMLRTRVVRNLPMEQVLVAKRDIPAHTVVAASDLGYMLAPVGSKAAGSIQDPKEVVGKRTVVPIFASEQIMPQKLEGNPSLLGPNERAIGVPVDLVRAVGMNVASGNRIDVYWLPPEGGQARREEGQTAAEARLVAADAVLLDIVTKESRSVFSPASPEGQRKQSDSTPAVAVVKVRQEDVPGVVAALSGGKIVLVKRG